MIKKIFIKHPVLREMFLYGVIGGSSATLDSGTYYLLTRFCSLDELLANFIGVNIGIAVSFILNTFINFRKTNNLKKRALSFFAVGYLGLAVSTFLMYLGIKVFFFNDMSVKVISIFIVAAFQFCLNKTITYGKIK